MHSHPNNASVKTVRTERENTVMQNSHARIHTTDFFKDSTSGNSDQMLNDGIPARHLRGHLFSDLLNRHLELGA